MVFTTHMVVGGALAFASGVEPMPAFFIGVISHWFLDAIPHWDYFHLLKSLHKDRGEKIEIKNLDWRFVKDSALMAGDALLGFLVVWWFILGGLNFGFQELLTSAVLWGMIGGIFPDFLQFVYAVMPIKTLKFVQRFQDFVHANIKLEKNWIMGPAMQIGIIVLTIFLAANF